jgi:DNA invertase Pin-like site-specific DNA recombinase
MSALARPSERLEGKVSPRHRDRLAAVYVRQSTAQQVQDHQESTRLQYGLAERAVGLGWAPSRVLVIDDDLGHSASGADARPGFQRLASEVGLDHVGIVLGIEMSRLARSGREWHQLLELCALSGTLLGDLDGVYDPAEHNDRLLLGLKGTISEAELHLIKQRMWTGRLAKARRGELAVPLPSGFVRRPSGEVALDPDEQVQAVVRLVFDLFDRLGTVNGVLCFLADNRIQLGVRVREGPGRGELVWRRPNRAGVQNMLRNPAYAGVYAYGRSTTDPRRRQAGRPFTGRVRTAREDWIVFLPGLLPAYISVEQYEKNRQRMEANRSRSQSMGAVRGGPALLAGLVACGRCTAKMTVHYQRGAGGKLSAVYVCAREKSDYGGGQCQQVAGPCVDGYVTGLLLDALAPGRAGGLPGRGRAGRGPPRAGRPDLAAAPGTRRFRRRPGPAPIPTGRAREPPGRPAAGKGLGDRTGRAAAPRRGVRPLHRQPAPDADSCRTRPNPCPGHRHPRHLARAHHHRCRPQAANPASGPAGPHHGGWHQREG